MGLTNCLAPIKVYPRVCGGTRNSLPLALTTLGLSPRVRGNLAFMAHLGGKTRSIPACAGEPHHGRRPAGKGGVYPRVCGGTCSILLPATRT